MVENKLVLVVDDTPIVRQGTALAVAGFGFETDEAQDGYEALEKLRTTHYAAVLMDCNMPRMDGLECTAKIREMESGSGRRTPIIGMSASNERDIEQTCLQAGMDDFLDKSCSNQELHNTLDKWVHGCTFAR